MADKNYIIENWWTPSQIKIVEDTSRVWTKQIFKATSGLWTEVNEGKLLRKLLSNETAPPDALIDNTAWDHEHCELCFETISDKEGFQHEGYTDGKEWLCANCYEKYLAPFHGILQK